MTFLLLNIFVVSYLFSPVPVKNYMVSRMKSKIPSLLMGNPISLSSSFCCPGSLMFEAAREKIKASYVTTLE